MIKAVIFDMDGVIIDNQPYQKMSFKQLFAEINYQISDKEFATAIKKLRGRPIKMYIEEFFRAHYNEKEMKELHQRRDEIYKIIFKQNFKAVAGFVDFINELRKTNFLLAVATSSTQELLDFTMDNLNVRDNFDLMMTADGIKNSKPHPEIYLETAKRLQVMPEQCLVFEDSFAGVESAQSANMRVALVTTSHKKEEFKNINLAINNFTEIKVADILKYSHCQNNYE